MFLAKQFFQKKGPCSDEWLERWRTWDRYVRPCEQGWQYGTVRWYGTVRLDFC